MSGFDQCSVGRSGKSCLTDEERRLIAGQSISPSGLLKRTGTTSELDAVIALINDTTDPAVRARIERVKEIAFRPDGPEGADALLDNVLITHVGLQIEHNYPTIKFGGVLTYDFATAPPTSDYANPSFIYGKYLSDLNTEREWQKLAFVFNTDHREGQGIHWTLLVIDILNHSVIYFDSYGNPPISGMIKGSPSYRSDSSTNITFQSSVPNWIEEVRTYFISRGVGMKLTHSEREHQEVSDMASCGVYCLLMMALIASDESLSTINKRRITQKTITRSREYFYSQISDYHPSVPSSLLEDL